MDVLAKRGTFGDYGHVTKGSVLKGIPEGVGKKLLASGSYVEATPENLKKFEAGRQAVKKRAAAEPETLKLVVDAAELEKMLGAVTAAVETFRQEIAAEIGQMKERLDAGADLANELAALKAAVAGVAGQINRPAGDKEGAGGAGGKAS